MSPNNAATAAHDNMLDDLFPRNVNDQFPLPDGVERITLLEDGRYAAYAYDLDCMWRWVITRDGEEVQDGPGLSLESSRHAVHSVLAFFKRRDAPPAST